MQPYSPEFAQKHLLPQQDALLIGGNRYRAVMDERGGYVEESGSGGTRRLAIDHVLGGKNTYYFLTPLDRGRLQVLPVAYDVGTKRWYDMAASGVRMHAEAPMDQPLPWTDPLFTFNTACYSCHVSQLQTNYDSATDSYQTTWREPGINCETCHANGTEHVALYKKDLNAKHQDMRILRTTQFTTAQRNEMCAPCHAKMSPISPGYQVTQRFFDHYDLVSFEDPDFYPDGRDLGENYTYTSWLLSPCVRDGKFDCIHCHTSSGRYRFATENPNGACAPCHNDQIRNADAHTNHKAGSPGSRCIDCHMPKTRFANMNRSDHSMLPPTPAVALRFKSPNACNLCHQDKDPQWADAQVRRWQTRDYQKPVLERAALIDAARRRDWSRLPAILAYINSPQGEPVFQVALIRLLAACPDQRKWPVLQRQLKHHHPLVRAAAASSFDGAVTPEIRGSLLSAVADDYRLVRIRAADSLAGVPLDDVPVAQREVASKASTELINAYQARPDDYSSQTNLGNYYLDTGDLTRAAQSYERALKLRPDSVPTMVNASMAYGRAGRLVDAERVLDEAVRVSPQSAPAHFNRGLLKAELRKLPEAEESLRKVLTIDPSSAQAAYNLCVLLAQTKPADALSFCNQAVQAAPGEDKYIYTLAFFLAKSGQAVSATKLLEKHWKSGRAGWDSRMLLADLYARSNRKAQAASLYRGLRAVRGLTDDRRALLESRLASLSR